MGAFLAEADAEEWNFEDDQGRRRPRGTFLAEASVDPSVLCFKKAITHQYKTKII